MPSLGGLRAFEAAGRLLSFRLAAEELGVTQSAISHQIAALEAQLKVRLFRRKARGVELTEAGILYHSHLRDAFDRIAQGTALVTRSSPAGDLMIQVYVTVAVRWLIPRLHRFHAAQPDIVVRVTASHFDWEFDAESADLGMIYTERPDRARLHYTHLLDARLLAVCSPRLLGNDPPLSRPSDLARHALLQVYTAADDWPIWLRAAGAPGVTGRAAPKFDSYLLAIEAAIEGQGVAIAPHFLVASDLRQGRLVTPFATEAPQSGRWYLTCRRERAEEPRIRRFREWLIVEIGSDATTNGGTA